MRFSCFTFFDMYAVEQIAVIIEHAFKMYGSVKNCLTLISIVKCNNLWIRRCCSLARSERAALLKTAEDRQAVSSRREAFRNNR